MYRFSKEEGKTFIGFDEDAEKLLLNYQWPGNVRQLENIVHSIIIMNNGPEITEEVLGKALGLDQQAAHEIVSRASDLEIGNIVTVTEPNTANQQNDDSIMPLNQVERSAIENAILKSGGNVTKAASLLEVNPSTLYRKIQGWEKLSGE